jgi:hypothetical protein
MPRFLRVISTNSQRQASILRYSHSHVDESVSSETPVVDSTPRGDHGPAVVGSATDSPVDPQTSPDTRTQARSVCRGYASHLTTRRGCRSRGRRIRTRVLTQFNGHSVTRYEFDTPTVTSKCHTGESIGAWCERRKSRKNTEKIGINTLGYTLTGIRV